MAQDGKSYPRRFTTDFATDLVVAIEDYVDQIISARQTPSAENVQRLSSSRASIIQKFKSAFGDELDGTE